ncbi:hypothetical protein KQI65_02770 [bacterium]|nr:hypothetical protein [bacterium]
MRIRHLSGMLLLLILSALPIHAQQYDDFENPTLEKEWTVFREVPDHWRLLEGLLEITTQRGALNGTMFNNVHNMFLQDVPSTGNIVLETQLYFSPDYLYHNAGLLYYIDDDNYIRVSRGIKPDTNGVWLEWEVDGETHFHSVFGVVVDTVFLKLERTRGVFTAYYATERNSWQEIASESISFPDGTPMAGLQAANGEGLVAEGDDIPARFEYFGANPLAVEDAAGYPASLTVQGSWPEPAVAGQSLTVSLSLVKASEVHWKLTDLLGREVLASRSAGRYAAGLQTIQCAIGDVPPGIYFMHVMAAHSRVVQRILLTR